MAQTILIADDFKEYAGLLEKSLQEAGFQTVTVCDGESAIRAARSKKPDLILLDIMMPNIGGTEVRNELMKDPSTRNIPIVFLTGLRAPRPEPVEGPHSAKKPTIDGVKVVGKSRDFSEILGAVREALPKTVR